MKRRTIIILVVIAAVLVGGYLVIRNMQQNKAAAAADYQTEIIQRGSLTAQVGATGTVRANQTALLTWKISGRIDEINVQLDEVVQAGDTLASLQTSSLPQSIILAQPDLVTARRSLETLLNSTTAQAQAQLALVNAQENLEDAQDKYDWKADPRATQSQVENADANLVIAKSQLENAQKYFDMVKDRASDDPVYAQALLQLNNAQTAVDNAQANLNWVNGTTRPDATAAEAELTLAEAKLADAQREWDRLKDGPDPDDVAAAQARIDALQATLDQVNLKAPFGGTITDIQSKPGDEVNPGTTTFRMDDLTRLLVDVQITEVDINRISVDQSASLTFDAIPNTQYEGKVIEVSRVGVVTQGLVNFTVTIELTNPDEAVLPGMTAAVNITTEQIDDTLLVPNRAVRLRNGERVVYLLKNGISTPVTIELGATSDNFSQIKSGEIMEGDTIILNPSATFDFGPGSGMPFGR